MAKQNMYRVTIIPGDGIGPEIVQSAKNVVESTGVQIEWEEKSY
jgi:isocitrate dehydrogenase (NAD+)